MKKHLIAAAVASAFTVPAMAQNVGISGTIDINPYYSSKFTQDGGNSTNRSGSQGASARAGGWSTSVLSFSGTEDLGGGLKAGFFFNQEIRQSDGSENARDIWLSLAGGFGEFKVGRQPTAVEQGWGSIAVTGTTNTAGTTDSGGYDLIAGSLGVNQTRAAHLNDTAVTVTAGSMARQAGVVRYTTPNINGFVASVEYINNKVDASETAGKADVDQISGSATFTMGKLTIVGGYGQRDVTGTLVANGSSTGAEAATSADSEVSYIGGTYDLGFAKLNYAYGAREDKTAAGAVESDLTVHNVGISIPMGAATVTASYYDGEDKRGGGINNERDLNGHQIGIRYSLSKRTTAYGVIGTNKNEGTGANAQTKVTSHGVGLVHTF